MEISMSMDAQDFDKLYNNSTRWGKWAEIQEYRWEHSTAKYDTPPLWSWKYAYWLGNDWSNVMLCRSWVVNQGFGYEVVWDMAEEEDGSFLGYVLLTDYPSSTWQRAENTTKEND